MARVVLGSRIVPHVCQLKKEFSKLFLNDIAGFGSIYSIRIYLLMMQFKKTGHVYLKLDELRDMLDVSDKYSAIKDFKKYVLDEACNEITKKSPYTVDYQLTDRNGKSGRGIKLTHATITFEAKTQQVFSTDCSHYHANL